MVVIRGCQEGKGNSGLIIIPELVLTQLRDFKALQYKTMAVLLPLVQCCRQQLLRCDLLRLQ